jgi:hypothetical protein
MNLMWAEGEGDFGSTESDFLRLACGDLISSAESTTHATMNFPTQVLQSKWGGRNMLQVHLASV